MGKSVFIVIAGAVLSIGLAGLSRADDAGTSDFPVIGKFRETFYYLVSEANFPKTGPWVDLLGMDDEPLATVSQNFEDALVQEGSGRLSDGRVINYVGSRDESAGGDPARFYESVHGNGDGVGRCALEPFHTIAVDPRQIPLGSLVQIDETVGMLLPDGSRHNGLWRAEDVGSAIRGKHIDLFIGASTFQKGFSLLARYGLRSRKRVTVRLVDLPERRNCTGRIFHRRRIKRR